MKRVVWTLEAARAVQRAYEYLYEFNPGAAKHLFATLLAAGNGLEHFPYRGRSVANTAFRELVTAYPYSIRYRIDGDNVVILRVRHSARRPTKP